MNKYEKIYSDTMSDLEKINLTQYKLCHQAVEHIKNELAGCNLQFPAYRFYKSIVKTFVDLLKIFAVNKGWVAYQVEVPILIDKRFDTTWTPVDYDDKSFMYINFGDMDYLSLRLSSVTNNEGELRLDLINQKLEAHIKALATKIYNKKNILSDPFEFNSIRWINNSKKDINYKFWY